MKSPQTSAAAAGALALALASAGCGAGGGTAAECTTIGCPCDDAEACGAQLACVSGVCVAAGDTDCSGAFCACTVDDDCRQGEACRGGICVEGAAADSGPLPTDTASNDAERDDETVDGSLADEGDDVDGSEASDGATAPDAPGADDIDDTDGPEDTAAADVPTDGSAAGDATGDTAADAVTDAADSDAEEASDGSGDGGPPPSLRVLFVGNSYIYTNDLPRTFASLAREAGVAEVMVDSVTAGGYRLEQHAADAARAGTALANALDGDPSWTHVVLQEQSQIPGFPVGVPERDASMVAAVDLAGRATAVDALPTFFMTWGYRTGDARNPGLFPDYPTMQGRLEAGYRAMADAAREAPMTVELAPVGLAFTSVYEAASAGGDPQRTGSDFVALYSGDGSHPAAPGTYLAAATLLATIADVDVRRLDAPGGALDAGLRDRLQDAAMAATSP
jgi:hypothetical protein